MTNGLQESRMREICTSGSMRGSDGRGVACNGRPSLSTLLVKFSSLVAAMPRGRHYFDTLGDVVDDDFLSSGSARSLWYKKRELSLSCPDMGVRPGVRNGSSLG